MGDVHNHSKEETAKFLSVDGIAMLLRAMPLVVFGLFHESSPFADGMRKARILYGNTEVIT